MKFYCEKFKSIRESRGLTQDELAAKIGNTRQAIQRWEKNKCNPKPKHIPLLAQILNCSIKEISDLEIKPEMAENVNLKLLFPDFQSDIKELENQIILIFLNSQPQKDLRDKILKEAMVDIYKEFRGNLAKESNAYGKYLKSRREKNEHNN